jgi:hypothetical protein
MVIRTQEDEDIDLEPEAMYLVVAEVRKQVQMCSCVLVSRQ